MAELKHVKIAEHGGKPVRGEIKFATGALLPGEVLAIPASQAKRAVKRGLVVEVQVEEVVAAPVKKKKFKPKAKAAAPMNYDEAPDERLT